MLTTELDRKLMVERFGTGQPRALGLHGWGRQRLDWAPVLTGLDALAPDLPGFGLSPAPPQAWGSAQYAEFVLPLLRKIGRSVLVGHSFGGRVALHLAVAAPELVSTLILTGVPLVKTTGAYRPRLRYRVGRRLHRLGLLDDARMERLRLRYGSADYRNATGVMRQVLVRVVNETYDRELGTLQVPVTLVWGEHDDQATVAVARAAERAVPDASLEVVPGAGHLMDGTLAPRLRARIVEALDRC